MSTSISHDERSRSGLTAYFAIALVFTWAVLGLAVLVANGIVSAPISTTVLISVATLGPALAAIAATVGESGWAGAQALLARAARWRVHPLWYAVAILLPAFVMLLAFLLWRVLGGPQLAAPPTMAWLCVPILIIVLTIPALFEEVGWRGYALPRLQSRSNTLVASLILGLIHALYHLPLWFIPGQGFDTLPFPYYVLLTTGLSVLFGWLYNSTGGSVLIVALLHAAINASPAPWGAALQLLPQWTEALNIQIPVAIVVSVCALIVALRTDPRTLTRRG